MQTPSPRYLALSRFFLYLAIAPAIAAKLLISRGFSNKQPAFPAGITRGL